MGLAGPKNRIKISHDPNNTKWTNDTQSFGHKMMTLQGWQPGEHLGVQDAAHAEFHTEANFSHIRVSIKDDNLGLGAKIGSGVGAGECTGLDAFQTLLGRLNGRDENELEKETKNREELKRAIYTEQRWGSIRFVRGGLLVGDKIQPLIDAEKERVRKLEEGSSSDSSSSEEESEEDTPVVEEKSKKSKKRKLEEVEETVPEVVAIKVKKSKKRKLEKDRGDSAVKVKKSRKHTSDASEDEVTTALKEVKLSKKKSKKDRETNVDSEDTPDDEERSRQRKKDKKEKKEKKREKREKKEKARAAGDESTKESKSKSKRDKKKDRKGEDGSESSRVTTKESTPLVAESSGRLTPMVQGMHAIRARNIAQKRMASMDVAALNQIFMIKSQT